MPPTTPLKRPSGGCLRRLLASLRTPTATGPLPVQTGFPTSLADIVVKNHGRLRKNPRRRHRAPAAAVAPPAAAAEPAPVSQSLERRELSVPDQDAAVPAPATVTARPGRGAGGRGADGFIVRPGLLAAGAAVALALLVVWSRQLVFAATVASLALYGIEYARTVRPRRPETEEEEVEAPCGRGRVSPVREAAESDEGGSDAAFVSSADADADSGELGCGDSAASVSSLKRKQRRRSLRKLLAGKLRNGRTARGTDSRHGGDAGEHERPETPRRFNVQPAAAGAAPAEETPEAIADDERWRRQRGGALPLPALVPIILAGLVAGKLPALALAVLCAAFSSSRDRAPVQAGQQSTSR